MGRKNEPSLLDPADDLTQVLGPELAKHFLDHRKALKKPMTPFAASLMAKKLRTFPDPVAAVEQSILKGWQDVFPVEAPRQPFQTVAQTRKQALAERIVNDHLVAEEPGRQGSLSVEPVRRLPQLQGDGRVH